jgi:hypothetical protein
MQVLSLKLAEGTLACMSRRTYTASWLEYFDLDNLTMTERQQSVKEAPGAEDHCISDLHFLGCLFQQTFSQ